MSYNAVGNILGKTRLGSTNTNSYTYPLAGQPRPYAVSGITGVVNGVTNPTFTYDANGNRLSGGGRTFTWTSFNKVATITEGSTSVSFVYDAEHQRLKQTSGSNTIVYLNDVASSAVIGDRVEYAGLDGADAVAVPISVLVVFFMDQFGIFSFRRPIYCKYLFTPDRYVMTA